MEKSISLNIQRLAFRLIIFLTPLNIQAQPCIGMPDTTPLKLCYIPNNRCNGDCGYTLDGNYMRLSSTIKLTNPANFGLSGVVKRSVIPLPLNGRITPTLISQSQCNIVFVGGFSGGGSSINSLIPISELNAIRDWSFQNSKNLAIISQHETSIWGYSVNNNNINPNKPTNEGLQTQIFNGPFGRVNNFNQGGSFQGTLNPVNTSFTVLATDNTGLDTKMVIGLDSTTNDIIVSDVDIFTTLGGISSGGNIVNNNDRLFANIIAYSMELANHTRPKRISYNFSICSGDSVLVENRVFKTGGQFIFLKDSALNCSDTINIKILMDTISIASISAGNDMTIRIGLTAQLNGSLPPNSTGFWRGLSSNPLVATFSNPNVGASTVTVSVPGRYGFVLTATTACATASDTVFMTFVNCFPSNALQFTGSNDRVTCDSPVNGLFNFQTNGTIEAWVKVNAALPALGSGTCRVVLGKDENAGNNVPKWFFGLQQGGLAFHINGAGYNSGYWVNSSAFAQPTSGTWYHVAMTKQGNTYTFFLNGNRVGGGNLAFPVVPTKAPLTIGFGEPCCQSDDVIDEVKFWNTVRTDAEIQADKTDCPMSNQTGLIAFYPMNDNAGQTTVADRSQYGNNGTLTNMNVLTAWVVGVQTACNSSQTIRIDTTICRGDSVFIQNRWLRDTTLYTFQSFTPDSCLIKTIWQVHFRTQMTITNVTVKTCMSSQVGIHRDTLMSILRGCRDSIVVRITTLIDKIRVQIRDSTCNLLLVGIKIDTFQSIISGCDSIVERITTLRQPNIVEKKLEPAINNKRISSAQTLRGHSKGVCSSHVQHLFI